MSLYCRDCFVGMQLPTCLGEDLHVDRQQRLHQKEIACILFISEVAPDGLRLALPSWVGPWDILYFPLLGLRGSYFFPHSV